MNLPETCPFCGAGIAITADGMARMSQRRVEFGCGTNIGRVADARRFQSVECEVRERTRLSARVAELEVENKNLSNRAELADGDVKKAHAILDASDKYIRRIEVELQSESQAKIDAEFHVAALKERLAELEARCKRLEEAAREVYPDSIESDHPWTELETRNTRALRDVLEAKPCQHCFRVECECSDFDVAPDIGDK